MARICVWKSTCKASPYNDLHIPFRKLVIYMKILSALLCAALLISLCACNHPTAPTSPSATDPESTTAPTQCPHRRETHEIAATCTEDGKLLHECLLCGDVSAETIPATGHTMTDADCIHPSHCGSCGVTAGVPLGHDYQNNVCSRCGDKLPDSEPVLPECEHDWRTTHTAPTCTQAGKIHYTCKKCSLNYSETLAATGHRLTEATCELPKQCTVCGAAEGSPLGHSYENGFCVRCSSEDPEYITYRVTVRTDKGKSVEGVMVHVYTTADTPAASGATGSNGTATLRLMGHTSYIIKVTNVPAGLRAKESYASVSSPVNITLTTVPVITPEDHSQANYKVGSIMGDFTLTDTDDNSYVFSQLLKEKKLIILDFWFVSCIPCKEEFPYFEQIQSQYSDSVQLLTINPFDSEAAIEQLRQEMGVTFPMCRDTIHLRAGFGATSFPTTVFIDETGKILKIHVGAFPSAQALIDAIERYLP